MPITEIDWADHRDRDIHVIVGSPSRNLADILFFRLPDRSWQLATTYLNNNNDVDLVFKPLFKTQGAQSPNTHSGHGISVNTQNGIVTLTNPLPSPRKANFIMEVEAKDHATGNVIDTAYLRIHVHQSVSQVWLTPGSLTVRPFSTTRPETTNFKFYVRAQFDDGVVGDISDMPDLAWSPAANVNTTTGKLILKAGDATGNSIQITVTLPAGIGGATANANMVVANTWDPANTIDASIVVGGGWPGTINPEKVPNVLLIGDGFAGASQGAFKTYVNSLVQFLKTNPLNRPYNQLATSINFWTAFLPSNATGITVNGEIYPTGTSPDLKARYVPGPKKPPAGHTGLYDLAQLIYVVGLPVRNDDLSNAARTNATIKTEWQALVNPDPTPKVDDALINRWRALAKRSLIDVVDSFLGVKSGEPVSDPDDTKDINLDQRNRITRDNMDLLLRALRDPRGVPISDLWAKRSDGTKPNNYDLVCILVAGNGRALNSDGYFFIDILDDIKISEIGGKNAFSLNYQPADIPNASDNDRGRTFAHELTHSFAIGDEYGGREGPPVGLTSAQVDEDGNLTLEADAQSAGQIEGDQIKWNWHRIKKAGVIDATIVDAGGGKFRLPLRLGDGHQFSVGDTVHLRFREYPKALPKNPKLSPPLEITDPAPTANEVHVRLKAGAVFNYPNLIQPNQFIAEFTPGSIVYIPTPAPASVFNANTYPYAEMVAKNIKDYITTNHKPLTAFPSVIDSNAVQDPVIPGVSLPYSFCYKRTRIVGLYSGGKSYHKGIFHPTGNCLMRESHTDGREICPVCRYILVDIIDPDKHWFIDLFYEELYPQK
jgi:IgA Peptidase M64